MRHLFASLGFCLLLTSYNSFATPVDVGGGIEQFTWQEFADSGSKLLKESGQRYFVSIVGENEVSERWTYAFRGRLYSGRVNYDGQLMNGAPYSTDVDYDGLSGIIDFTGRFLGSDGELSDWGLRFGVGGETWRRHLLGASGYSETYNVGFGRLGIAYSPQQGWFGEAGAKYPLSVSEKVKLYDGVTLAPQGAFSLFATVGYNFNYRWSLKGYYDSYRFKASDTKPLTNGGVSTGDVYQPESRMDLLGITIGFYF